MYEKKYEKPASLKTVIQRTGGNFVIGMALIALAVLFGMWGYRYFTGMSNIDAFLNASMVLSGMGQVGVLTTANSKLYAGFYALFSGIVFLGIIALIFTPIFHHLFHKFHYSPDKVEHEEEKETIKAASKPKKKK